MRQVYLAASKSKDPRTNVGAVLVKNKIAISQGYNGFPRKLVDSMERLGDRDTKLSYTCHAEHNAILNAARNGTSTLDSILYTNGTPCHECTKAIIQAGVSEVVVHQGWETKFNQRASWTASLKLSRSMLEEADVPLRIFNCDLGLMAKMNEIIISV